ncbi:MAG TPA: hypothetical protein VIL07_09305 [Symbiobacteriaceae bacterium]
MAGEHLTPGTTGNQAGQKPIRSQIDLDQLTQELAQELGVDPASLRAQGPAAQKVRAYEAETHSTAQRPENR